MNIDHLKKLYDKIQIIPNFQKSGIQFKDFMPLLADYQSIILTSDNDTIENHSDSIKEGDKVGVLEDLITIGGTAMTCPRLIEKLGGNIIYFSFIMQIDSLSGLKTLKETLSFIMHSFRYDETKFYTIPKINQ